MIIFGVDYAYLSAVKKADGNYISFSMCNDADKGKPEILIVGERMKGDEIYIRVEVRKGGEYEFSFSEDGKTYTSFIEKLVAKPGRWVGAKLGLFCTRTAKTNDSGYVDVDWFRVESL